jgi:hypothetical protein
MRPEREADQSSVGCNCPAGDHKNTHMYQQFLNNADRNKRVTSDVLKNDSFGVTTANSVISEALKLLAPFDTRSTGCRKARPGLPRTILDVSLYQQVQQMPSYNKFRRRSLLTVTETNSVGVMSPGLSQLLAKANSVSNKSC